MIADAKNNCYVEPAFALSAWCPNCGARLRVRSGRRGLFIGCEGYPDCHFTQDYDDLLQILGARIHTLELDNAFLRRCPPAPAAKLLDLTLDRELKKLVSACHPDRWQGHPAATALTQAVLALRDKLREGKR